MGSLMERERQRADSAVIGAAVGRGVGRIGTIV